MGIDITFLGAAGTVTGSKYLVRGAQGSVLIDCGLFQGNRDWREKNWNPVPDVVESVDAVLLTHAHIDHIGMLPRFNQQGLGCPIYCTKPTLELAEILLPDSATLQEEEASYRSRHGFSRHSPVLPLYTGEDAARVLKLFRAIKTRENVRVAPGIEASWSLAGHIIGACSINLWVDGRKITFSGDLGRYGVPIFKDPDPVELGELLLIEATYGNRLHQDSSPANKLAEVVNLTARRGGVVVIPSFAVGRTQTLLFYLRELKAAGKIPDIPVLVDSPMASDATDIYRNNPQEYDSEAMQFTKNGGSPFTFSRLRFITSRDESIKLNSIAEPMIIISASGMLSGGRILHHLKHRVSSPLNSVIFVGYQPKGGRGDWMLSGAKSMRLLGEEVQVRASVFEVSGLSAHGDRSELLRWCSECSGTPKKVAIVHSEPDSATDFAASLHEQFKWESFVPQFGEVLSI